MKPENLILLVPVVLLIMLTMQNRRRKRDLAAAQASLLLGAEVMTGAGMFGTVVGVDGDQVTLETSPGVTSVWLRQAVVRIITPGGPDQDAQAAAAEQAPADQDRSESSDQGQPVKD